MVSSNSRRASQRPEALFFAAWFLSRLMYTTITFMSSTYVGFAASSNLLIDGDVKPVNYSYSVLNDNNNDRSLMSISLQARQFMYDCPNCPRADYEKFFDYYNSYDYAHQWVKAAYEGGITPFKYGIANFQVYDKAALVGM
jgi:hypothetical protein